MKCGGFLLLLISVVCLHVTGAAEDDIGTVIGIDLGATYSW